MKIGDQISNPDVLLDMGKLVWEKSFALTRNEIVASKMMLDWFNKNSVGQKESVINFLNHDACGQSLMLALARWYDSGCPTLQIGHKLAASLMSTRLNSDIKAYIKPPWPGFIINLPTELLFTTIEGKLTPLTRIAFYSFDKGEGLKWNMTLISKDGGLFTLSGYSVDDMIENRDLGPLHTPSKSDVMHNEQIDSYDRKTSVLIFRLVLGIALELSNPDNLVARNAEAKEWGKSKRKSKLPTIRLFELARKSTINCVDLVRSYTAGNGTSPAVQILVRGHWKHQACGTGRTQRKVIHVEPYWRGPEDAPIPLKVREYSGEY